MVIVFTKINLTLFDINMKVTLTTQAYKTASST
jgi:hypothetical protein